MAVCNAVGKIVEFDILSVVVAGTPALFEVVVFKCFDQ